MSELIEKPLIILMFMYSVSFMVLAGQYLVGDVFGITLVNYEGVEIKSSILSFINQDTINTVTGDIVAVNGSRNTTLDYVEQSFQVGIDITFELLTLLTGTYIFSLIYLLAGPDSAIVIAGMVVLYAILLGRAIIAYVRGV